MKAALPSLPFPRPHPLRVAPVLGALSADGPVHRVRTAVGDPAWLVTGHEQVRALLGDDRLGMAHPDPDRAARASDSALFGGRPPGNVDTEDAERTRFRALLQPFFAPTRMRALSARVDELVSALLDELARQGPPADLHAALAVPLPVVVICELLGVPDEDRERFREYTQATAVVGDRNRSEAGLTQLWAYTRELVARRRLDPGDDLISRLCTVDNGALDDDYIAMLAAMILFAGHETTVVQIGLGAALVLTNLDVWQAVRDDPTVVEAVVEECLRAGNTGGGGVPRYPRVDIDVAGLRIPAGDLILLDIGAANHDPDVFGDPHQLDVHRGGGGHLTFGHGAHYCIGAPLARIELQAVFAQLIPRFPTMRLAAPVEHLRLRDDLLTGGLAELPVMW
jgi:cytochrome P450